MAIADELEPLIRTVPDFPKSGIKFRDITTLLASGPGLARTVDALAQHAREEPVDAVAGMEARGFIFGTALAIALGVGFIPLRKAGKLPVPTIGEDYALEYGTARLELDPTLIAPGMRVLMTDDLLATGGTAAAGAALLRRAGAVVERALFVIDLPELGGARVLEQSGVRSTALISYDGH